MREKLAILALFSGCAAFASVVVSAGNPGGLTDHLQYTNNPPDGTSIYGITDSGRSVLVEGDGNAVLHGNGGQARVEPAKSGDWMAAAYFSIPGTTFTSMVMNINPISDGTVTFVVNGVDYAPTFSLSAGGDNFFNVVASGETMFKVGIRTAVLDSPSPLVVDIREVSFDGIEEDSPEPGTLLLTAGGLAGAMVLRRRRASRY